MESGILYVDVLNGTFVQNIGLNKGTVIDNLPPGFSYNVVRESDTRLRYEITGKASAHAAANTLTNISVRVDMDKINGSNQSNFGTNSITITFND